MEKDNLCFYQKTDKNKVSYDNILNFSFVIINNSHEKINNVMFRQENNIDPYKSFISCTKNGIDFNCIIEENFLIIGDLYPDEKIEIQINALIERAFKETLNSIGMLKYENKDNEIKECFSNKEEIYFNGADFQDDGEFTLYFDKEVVTAEDEILIGINIENKGNLTGEKVYIGDILPDYCTLIDNSLIINDSIINIPGNVNSILIGKVNLFQRIAIRYKVKISNDFTGDILKHKVTLTYENGANEVDVIRKIIRSNEATLKVKLVKFDYFTKTVSEKETTVGEIVSFFIEGKNSGNLKLYDVILKDTLTSSFKLISDSVLVNGIKAYNSDFEKGILLDELKSGEGFKVSYDSKVLDFKNNYIEESSLSFKFKCDEGLNPVSKTITSTGCSVEVKSPCLQSSKKLCNKKSAFLGDEATILISLKNSGNIKCENLTIVDKIPTYLTFIPNSLYIAGEKIYSNDIGEIVIPYINGGESIEISYRTIVNDIPLYNRKENKLNLHYNYKVSDKIYNKEELIYGEDIIVNGAIIKKNNIIKKVDRLYAIINDEITYNIMFKNEGNFSCEKVFIKEEENRSLEFIENSLNINGVEKPYDIFKGFLLGEIEPGETINLTFRCKIKSIPYSSMLYGLTYIDYEYRRDSSLGRIKKQVTVKSDDIIVKSAIINNNIGVFTKETSSPIVMVGDKIQIRIHLRNMGNTDAYNVVLTDEEINGLEVMEDTFTINNVKENYKGATINIGNLRVSEEKEIIYFAKVNKDILNRISSQVKVNYCFYGNDDGTLINSEGLSNEFKLSIFNPSVLITESVNKDSFEVGEILNYNIYLTNNGNVDLKSLALKLNIGNLEGLTLNELSINRKIISGVSLKSKISIGSLDLNESISISMKIDLNKLLMKKSFTIIPSIEGNYIGIDDTVTNVYFKTDGKDVSVSLNKIIVQKMSSNQCYLKGEAVNYLITVRNDGTNIAENIVVYDNSIEQGFVEDSLTINGYPIEESFLSGIPIGALKQGECVFIRYSAIYDNDYVSNEVFSTVRLTSEFFEPKYGYMKKEFYSDELRILLAKASLKIVKTSNKKVVSYGEKVNFITTIENNGTVILKDLVLNEKVSLGFESIGSSIFVNGSKVLKGDSLKGINLPDIKPREVIEIATAYTYNNYKRMMKLITESLVVYNYKLEGEKDIFSKSEKSNKVYLEGEISTFKNITIDHEVELSEDELWISEIIDIIVIPKITKSYVVKTIQNTSYGNESLTGYKLVIRGVLEEKIEYIANTEQESIHMIIKEERFSTTIILPEKHDINENVNITTIVHDVYSKLINEKRLQLSINLTVEGLM